MTCASSNFLVHPCKQEAQQLVVTLCDHTSEGLRIAFLLATQVHITGRAGVCL